MVTCPTGMPRCVRWTSGPLSLGRLQHPGPGVPATGRFERRLRIRSIRVPDGLAFRVDHRLECEEHAIELAHRGEARRPRRGARRRRPAAFKLDRDGLREAACLGDRVVLMAPRPGRIAEVFDIPLPRPRDINTPALAEHAARIAAALRGTAAAGGAVPE